MGRKLFILTVSLVLATSAAAQESDNRFSADIQLLTRGEVRSGGLYTLDEEVEDFAAFILQRTRLGASYNNGGFQTRATFQNSGTWGNAGGGSISLFEGWVQYSKKGFFSKIGRQSLSYDDQRVFGSDDWSMTGISHDVLKVGYDGRWQRLHLFAAFNQNPSNLSGGTYYTGGYQAYKAMEALWYHFDIKKAWLGTSLLFMNLGMQGGVDISSSKTFQQQLFGGYLTFEPKKFKAEASYYRQAGKNEGGMPIQAWMASAKVTYSPSGVFRVFSGYDYLSGDDSFATPDQGMVGVIHHEKIKGFNSVYGSHHKFYGAMDFFYVRTYRNGFTPGLQNAYLGVRTNPWERVSFDAAYHFFATAAKLQNADKPLGHEFEMTTEIKINKFSSISAGYSFMKGSKTMEVLKRTAEDKQHLNWVWAMLIVSPTVFSVDWR